MQFNHSSLVDIISLYLQGSLAKIISTGSLAGLVDIRELEPLLPCGGVRARDALLVVNSREAQSLPGAVRAKL